MYLILRLIKIHLHIHKILYIKYENCRNPTLAKCGVKPNTSKVGDLESSETLDCLGFDSKAQNTLH